ncbi:MAG TPA: CmcJ/NvfI family oxidoreductase [Paraburkholderia sp.]|nr:CmcJ/NvfI family oxidoreductase [Paraburkholderia sp.]
MHPNPSAGTLDPRDLQHPLHASTHRFTRAAIEPPSVLATQGYLQPTTERPYNYAFEPPEGMPWENYARDERVVRIADGRRASSPGSVHREGFELWNAPSALRDFSDADEVARQYYPEVAELACAATGAARAYVFDHLVRRREADRRPLGFGRSGKGAPAAANGVVHNDYTEDSGRRRLALVLGDEAARRGGAVGRYSIVNVWRSIKGPVLDTPLAVCDARSVDVADLVVADVRYPRRTGEIYLVMHAARHRWSYFSAMDRHEALVFKQYDSQLSGAARFTPHAAFDHPDAPADAPLRESIEARCLVVYE